MRPFILSAVVAAVAVVAAGASSATIAVGPPSVSLISFTTSTKVVDAGVRGPSRGDRYITTSRLTNAVVQFGKKKGAIVGTDRSTVTLTSSRAGRVSAVAMLPGGTLIVRGLLREDMTGGFLSAPVVSGTGAFSGARGTLTISGTATRARNTYRLTYRGSA